MLGVTISYLGRSLALRLLQGLVLPGKQDVALVLSRESDRGIAGPGIENLHV